MSLALRGAARGGNVLDRYEGGRSTMALRLLSAIGGILVFLGSAVFTAGTALAAPIGILVGRRLAARKGRPFTVFGSWVSAAVASSIAVLLAFALVVALTPAAEWREMQDAM